MRAREFLQLMGLGPGIRFYPFEIRPVSGLHGVSWVHWLVPKPPPSPNFILEVDFFSAFLKAGDWAIDIGAHVGDTTLGPALVCGKTGGMIAFEPNPTTMHVLSLNASVNRSCSNVAIVPFAAGDDDRYLTFEYGDHWCSNGGHHDVSKWVHGGAYTIHVKQVDTLKFLKEAYSPELQKVRYIKIDAEAMDWVILENLRPLIESKPTVLRLEIGETQEGQERGLRYLRSIGYTAYEVNDARVIDKFERYVPRRGSFDILAFSPEDPCYDSIMNLCTRATED